MKRLPVESSDIVSIGYDPAGRILEVEFQGNRIYQYRDVDADLYAQFLKTDSFGTFFFAHINGRYRYDKVTGSAAASNSQTLAFVSGSAGDLHNLQMACEPYDIEIEPLELPLDQIQSDDPEEIAIKKAKQAYKLARQPVVVDVSYWNVIALHGFPGAYMDAVANWLQPADFFALLQDKTDRAVCLTKTLAYYDGKRQKLFSQDYWGTIATEARGQGSSIEQIVIMAGQDKTLAELHESGTAVWPPVQDSPWQEFAKWLRLQRRLGR